MPGIFLRIKDVLDAIVRFLLFWNLVQQYPLFHDPSLYIHSIHIPSICSISQHATHATSRLRPSAPRGAGPVTGLHRGVIWSYPAPQYVCACSMGGYLLLPHLTGGKMSHFFKNPRRPFFFFKGTKKKLF